MSSIEQLYQLTKKNSLIVAGALSGTSADGIDVAIVEFKGAVDTLGAVNVLATKTYKYSSDAKGLLSLAPRLDVEQVSVLNRLVAEDFAKGIQELTKSMGAIDLVASHGQTVFHHSSGVTALSANHPSTLQVGSGSILASILKVPVVYDFRSKDIANGGQGAPLTPATDFYLYRNLKTPAGKNVEGILNLGGIGNLTVFGSAISNSLGFDTGPANAPIDRLVKIFTGGKKDFDENGDFAAKGIVNQSLLQKLLSSDTYLSKSLPKSTGFEAYGDLFVEHLLKEYGKPVDEHLIATVSAYTAHTVAWSINNLLPRMISSLVVAGGGAKNSFIMQQLQSLLPSVEVLTSNDVGVSSDFREAIAFALLGYACIRGFYFDLSSITGAKEPALLGSIAL